MKKLAIQLILIIYALFFAPTVHAKEVISWCAFFNWNPWIYPYNNSYDGILIEELNVFKKNAGVDTKVHKNLNWKRCQQQVLDGKVDFILGGNRTPEREKVFSFVDEPAAINNSVMGMYTLSDGNIPHSVNRLEDLKGYRFVTIKGTTWGKVIDNHIHSLEKSKIEYVNSEAQIIRKILTKRGDYFVSSESILNTIVNNNQESIPELTRSKFRQVVEIKRSIPIYVFFKKDSEQFLKLNKLFEESFKQYHSSTDVQSRIEFHKQRN
ncbi:transporter substrate-binding domain-containing protein [Vibrio sp. S4M6]|uniref:substrate-binding periplasmic protein n=1 Tax=Vibrio sinus TaxID=2946865 RepID=UPI00202A9404|nr:transporter substrate-binding domain-containing protein [Vibrio sinus]MCL9783301.1 transporter substrate-binding domain-containing protein [Vibrio sinus]